MKRFLTPVVLFVLLFVPMYLVGSALAQGSGSGSGSAISATTTEPVASGLDPIGSTGDSISLVTKLYKSGQFFNLAIVALFLLITILEAKVQWFKEGKRKVYATAALGGLLVLVTSIVNGVTPNLMMVFGAATTAVALALKPSSSS